jgi:hypothetical protein
VRLPVRRHRPIKAGARSSGAQLTFLIDKSGGVRFDHEGAADLNIIQREIETLLAKRSAPTAQPATSKLSPSRAFMISPSARPAVT